MQTCPQCQKELPDNVNKCKYCDYRFAPIVEAKTPRAKKYLVIYLLLIIGVFVTVYLLTRPKTPEVPEAPTLASITAPLGGIRSATIDQDTAIVEYEMDTQYDVGGYITKSMMDIREIAPGVFGLPDRVNYLDVIIYGKIVDKYGNETDQLILEFILSRTWSQKVNWENIANKSLAQLIHENAAIIQVHPSLTNSWSEYIK